MRLVPDVRYRVILVLISAVHFFAAFIFESYVIDSDFMIDFDTKSDDKHNGKRSSSSGGGNGGGAGGPSGSALTTLDEQNQLKCYPKRGANQTPYQKIESQIREQAHFWPPITPVAPPQTAAKQPTPPATSPVIPEAAAVMVTGESLTVNENNNSSNKPSPLLTNGKIHDASESTVVVRAAAETKLVNGFNKTVELTSSSQPNGAETNGVGAAVTRAGQAGQSVEMQEFVVKI
jgi:hypothetical protein